MKTSLPTFGSPGGSGLQWSIPKGSALIAVSYLYGTTIGTVTPTGKVVMSPTPAASVKDVQASRGGNRLGYVAARGIDPGENFIETEDLSTGVTQQVKAASGFAIFGFIIAPDGRGILFSEAALVGTSSSQVPWRLLIADLEQGQARQVMSSEASRDMGESVPVPFAWSGLTGEVYLRAVRPFRGGGGDGIWAMRPDGSGLRQVLREEEFLGTPLLSPDGGWFAYLASDLQALPAGFIAGVGEPPGNILLVRGMKTGEERTIVRVKDRAIGALAWSLRGESLLTSRREWMEGRLRDTSIVAFSVEDSTERQVLSLPPGSNVRDIFDLGTSGLLWVNEGRDGSDLMVSRGTGPFPGILTVPQGQIKIVGYVD